MYNENLVLFVIFPMTEKGVLVINDGHRLILPRYESEPKDGSESRTDSLHTPMLKNIGYAAQEIHLTDTNDYHTKIDDEDWIYHACLAHGCTQCQTGKMPVMALPITEWIKMIKDKKTTDELSIVTTNSALEWIAMPQPESFSRKKENREKTQK